MVSEACNPLAVDRYNTGGDSQPQPNPTPATHLPAPRPLAPKPHQPHAQVTSQDDNYDGMVIEVPFVNRDILFPRVGVWNTTVSPMEGWAVEVIDGDGYEEGMVVLVHGMPVTHLSVISATWIRFRTPAMANASRAETYNDVVMRNVDGGFIDLPGHVYYTERCPYVGQEGPSEEECTVCREGADCAGGDRIRPTEGYWNPGETSGLLLKCRPAARCVGFLSLANQSACADGYDSMMCGSCAPEYWPKAGLCAECPGSPFPLLLIVIDVVLMLLLVGALVGASYRILSAAGLSIVLLQFIRFVPLYAAGTLDDNKVRFVGWSDLRTTGVKRKGGGGMCLLCFGIG